MDSPPPEIQDAATAPASPHSASLGAAAQKAGDRMVAASKKSGVEIKKIVVAIHGIGDQYRQATIQSVVARFGYHFDFPATVPLGSFYSPSGQVTAFTLKAVPPDRENLASIGFLEAYWADIPRRVQQQGYTIQESKAWARTIVERIRARYGDTAKTHFRFGREDFRSASMVLEEMIETIATLGNLLFLAEKAGILKFDLDTMLTSYLGDVQIVADFANYRAEILAQFNEVLDKVYNSVKAQQKTDPEIYVVAHSEGTVVAFMALLQAMSATADSRPNWIERVHGLMTIGSPIDKHLIMWPDIWDAVQTPFKRPEAGAIRWRNYYDYGDPVGFELDTARAPGCGSIGGKKSAPSSSVTPTGGRASGTTSGSAGITCPARRTTTIGRTPKFSGISSKTSSVFVPTKGSRVIFANRRATNSGPSGSATSSRIC